MNYLAQPATRRRPEIVVIGGGFSGAAFVLHLLRDFPTLAARVTIVEPRAALGAGLAYTSSDPQHRINVAAARMAVFAEDPTHFDRWFRASGRLATDPDADVAGVGVFPRRSDFADYIGAQLAAATAACAELRHVQERAMAVLRDGAGFRIALQHGGDVAADMLVLASGHPATEALAPLRNLTGDARLISDPWAERALTRVGPDARLLIVGTGLTMADVVAGLRARGHRAPIVAVSRRGLLPRPRTSMPVTPTENFLTPPSSSACDLLRRVRRSIIAAGMARRPWEDAIDAVRAQGRAIWAVLPPAERRRLLRHAQPFWDVHRYQCAPRIDAVLRRDLASGALRIVAASVRGAAGQSDGSLRVDLHPRGTPANARQPLACDMIVTCTGPAHRTAITRNPALHSLAEAGLIRPDAYGLGIEVDDQGRAIGAAGQAHPALFVVGPPARGTWGELMGLPQVSDQPREVAAVLARHFAELSPLARQEMQA
jgi:uncharacterized NAD(P)/FAD-binding protein YdhS